MVAKTTKNIKELNIHPGKALPFGANITERGVQFSIFSRNATHVWLLLFDSPEDSEPSHSIHLDAAFYRTGDCWHVLVETIEAGQCYLFRVDGPYSPKDGHRFNKNMVLLDPYAKALTGPEPWGIRHALGYDASRSDGDLFLNDKKNWSEIPKCVVVDDAFDWENDSPLNYPFREIIIYETHVRGLTKHPSTIKKFNIQHPGTFAGVIEMIPYLKELGITSIELLPIAEFDENEYSDRMLAGKPMKNYWGYSTVAFFAPKGSYASSNDGTSQVREFKTMVRELHKAGIEVILDVVFNHTAEGDQSGPTFAFRGLENSIYYILKPDNRFYMNLSGCGNTMNCNHPVLRSLILDCLRYWVQEMHVDGFRFDLGSILGRDSQGHLLDNPPLLEHIAEDPFLRDTKIIAEAWDAGGAYQVGSFPGDRWAEWNDHFRNDVRRFWCGETGLVSAFATRLSGSADLYLHTGRKPYHSINYVTAHDGFTLSDLVSFNQKHNTANGEDNRDGADTNFSCNWGVEGESEDEKTEKIRNRMVKNFWTSLLLSSGTPMILGGDEFRRTQGGNNNAYCQDNETSWCDFSQMDTYADTFRFAQHIIAFRKNHPAMQRQEFFSGQDLTGNRIPDITWFDENGNPMNWQRRENILALRIDGSSKEIHYPENDTDIIMLFNASETAITFRIPSPPPGQQWCRTVDTALPSPWDIVESGTEVEIDHRMGYTVEAWALAVFVGLDASSST